MLATVRLLRRPSLPAPRDLSRATVAEAVAAVLFTLWVVWPLIGPGGLVTGYDTVAYSGPNLHVTLDAFRHGRIAQWNPLIYGGVSHLGNIQAAPLYPLKLPFAWTETHRAWCWLIALHVVLLAAGTFWLVRRRLGLRAPAGLVATVAVAGSGAVMVRMVFFEQILVLAWAPWLLGALDAAVASPGRWRRPVAGLALAVAAVGIAGHPQSGYVLAPLAAVWAVVRAVEHGGRDWWRRLGPVAAGGVLGLLLAAPQLLPTAAMTARSANGGPRDLATLSNPGFSVQVRRLPGTWLGDPWQTIHSITSAGYENLTFIGVVATALAVVGLTGWRRGPSAWTVRGLALVVGGALVAALGPRWPVYRIAFEVVPGFAQARVPGRWVMPAVVATALLAALGTDRLVTGRIGRTDRTVVAVALAGGAVAVVALPFTNPGAATLLTWALTAAVVVAATAIAAAPGDGTPAGTSLLHRRRIAVVTTVALLGAVELGLAHRNSVTRQSRTEVAVTATVAPHLDWLRGRPGRVLALTEDLPPPGEDLAATLRPNANVWFDLESVDGYDGGIQVTQRWADTFAAHAGGPFEAEAPARHQLALPLDPAEMGRLAVHWLLLDTRRSPAAEVAPAWGPPVFVDGPMAVLENPAWPGPAWLEPTAAEPSPAGATVAVTELRDLTVRRPRPEHLTLTFDAPRAGRLLVPEQWDRGWRAELDGTPVAVVPTGTLYLGTDVPAGRHVLELRYTSAELPVGTALAATGLVVVTVLGVGRPIRRRTR